MKLRLFAIGAASALVAGSASFAATQMQVRQSPASLQQQVANSPSVTPVVSTPPSVPVRALPSPSPVSLVVPSPHVSLPSLLPRPTASPISTVWVDHSNGWTLTTRRSVARPRAGQLVHFDVTAVAPVDGPDQITVFWGDNMGDDSPEVSGCPDGWRVPAGHPFTLGFDHAWRIGRTYTITIEPVAYGGCSGANPGTGSAPRLPKHQIPVSPGPLLENGPLPSVGTVDFGSNQTTDPNATLHLAVIGEDHDGYVAQFIFDWGDGSPNTVYNFLSGCRRPSDDAWIFSRNSENDVAHKYAGDVRNYVVSFTIVSSGCQGQDQQRTTIRWRPNFNEHYVSPSPTP